MLSFRQTKQQTNRWKGKVWSVVGTNETSLILRERNASIHNASQGDLRVRHSGFILLTLCNIKQQNKTFGTETSSSSSFSPSPSSSPSSSSSSSSSLFFSLLGAERPLVMENFGLLNDTLPFPSILDAGYPVLIFIWQISCLMLSSHLYLSLPCDRLVRGFHLTPNCHYMGRTTRLTSRCCILYIYSTNIRTEYFKHAA